MSNRSAYMSSGRIVSSNAAAHRRLFWRHVIWMTLGLTLSAFAASFIPSLMANVGADEIRPVLTIIMQVLLVLTAVSFAFYLTVFVMFNRPDRDAPTRNHDTGAWEHRGGMSR